MYEIEEAKDILTDLQNYLESIDQSCYQDPLKLLSGSTIGSHTRHVIEYFQCLIQHSKNLSINYNLRKRDLEIEQKKDHAVSTISLLRSQLDLLDPRHHIKVYRDKEESHSVASSIGRELSFNAEHAIHHMAIIKMAMLSSDYSCDIPERFGVAPSTILHRHSNKN